MAHGPLPVPRPRGLERPRFGQPAVGGHTRGRSPSSRRALASPTPSADTVLRIHADLLDHWLREGRRRPLRWRARAFEREVDLVRMHLRPIHSLEMLAASYGRES